MPDSMKSTLRTMGENARTAARLIGRAETGAKNQALLAIAAALEASASILISENQRDLEAGRQNHIDSAMLERLELTLVPHQCHGRWCPTGRRPARSGR